MCLGLSTSCSATFWQLFIFRATFFLSSNLLHFEQFLDRRSPKIIRLLFKGHTNISEDLRSLPKIFEEHLKTFQLSAHFASETLQNSSGNMTSSISSRFFSIKENLVVKRIFPLICYLDTSFAYKSNPQREISIYLEKFS